MRVLHTPSIPGKIIMFAVVEIAGQQLKVSPAEKVFVPKMQNEIGSTIKFDRVLLISDDKSVKVGNPTVKGVSVEARVLGHAKDDKVIVFKKKRRKGYRVRRGHRQQYTQIEITSIG
jgi:large subunit ribosomal protein L21